ncbi:M15 family metallopeptidase [Intestinibacter sp.]|uniref:M15 family metallopeptidase n=1 Tax=Intestinibacter sp. TaxID=1965304 RepID=UPI003F145FE1
MKKVQVLLLLLVVFIGFNFTKNIVSNKYVYGDNTSSGMALIVSEENQLTSRFIPDNLREINISFANDTEDSNKKMTKEAKEALEKLVDDAAQDNIDLIGKSAYISYADQYKDYYMKVLEVGSDEAGNLVEKPGTSEHQTGLCIDLTNKEYNLQKDSEDYKWIEKNSYKYGFVIRDCKEKNVVHIRYVGEDVAKYICENNLTLEAYVDDLSLRKDGST